MKIAPRKRREPVKLKTHNQIIAEKFNTSEIYVAQIARGERLAIRGKAILIRQEIEKYLIKS